jgi:hypothetical protein
MSILIDGAMHGAAMRGGLRGDPPEEDMQELITPSAVVVGKSHVLVVGSSRPAQAVHSIGTSETSVPGLPEAISFYGRSCALYLGVSSRWASDVFADGLLVGWRAAATA